MRAPTMGARSVAKAALSTASDMALLVDGIRAVADAIRVVAEQRTLQFEIQAKARVEVARVEAVRDVMLHYLDRSFDERRGNFTALFEQLDAAIQVGNLETVGKVLDAVVTLARSSPFRDLAAVCTASAVLKDKGREWEF